MRLSIIGTGKMGNAIIKGILDHKILPADQITGTDLHDEARQAFLSLAPGLRWANTPAEAATGAEVILLAVKPQNMADLLPQLHPTAPGTLFISIAAGVTLARLATALGPNRPIFRVMPNTPLMVGEGVTAAAANDHITPAHRTILEKIFGTTGQVFTVTEPQLDAVTALSGSGPAFIALIAAAFTQAAVTEGLPESLALPMTLQTMRGTATLLQQPGMTPENPITQVTSKGGTTEAGLKVLQTGELAKILTATVQAAAHRSRELAKI